VTRTSEVRPELLYGRFTCLDCGTQTDHIEQQFKYTEPTRCPNYACQNRIRWQLDLDASRFVDWQRCRVQENAQEIPSGSMPRCIDVIMRHDAVEVAKAGDKCLFTGSLIVVPDVGKMFGGAGGVMATMSSDDGGGSSGGGDGEGRSGGGDSGNSGGSNNNNWAMEGATGLKMLGVRDLNYRLCFLCTSVEPADGRVSSV
jgi:DNA replication licensing factor MCM6